MHIIQMTFSGLAALLNPCLKIGQSRNHLELRILFHQHFFPGQQVNLLLLYEVIAKNKNKNSFTSALRAATSFATTSIISSLIAAT